MAVEIIAELAQGFEGRPEQARLLMKAAAAAGADAAKYQLVYADELATPDYKYYDLFKSLEMDDAVWAGLARYAAELGIKLQVDIFGLRSLKLAEQIGADAIKLHGTDIANVGLLNAVARSSVRKVLLGAGGAFSSEIEQAASALDSKEVIILLGFQGYPTPDEANQIARIRVLLEGVGSLHPHLTVGFADHALPGSLSRVALAAVAVGAGASVLEKHLTLGRNLMLEDHESALNPDEFLEFAHTIRNCALALGESRPSEEFGMGDAEIAYRKMIRRHVVANKNIDVGETVGVEDVALKRSAGDDLISDLTFVYRKKLKNRVLKNSPIRLSDLE